MLGLKKNDISLCDHDELWKTYASDEIALLKKSLGNILLDIQHVGSTSIDNIKSRPIIDLAACVKSIDDAEELSQKLCSVGYTGRIDNTKNVLKFIKTDSVSSALLFRLFIVADGSAEWSNYILFRDYLNACPEMAEEYEGFKVKLTEKQKKQCPKYTAEKDKFINRMLFRAQAWSYLNKVITVKIDRPIGYVHKKKNYSLTYPINYGFVPGVMGGDGEELDAYILGVKAPVDEFEGRVVGVVHRENDTEDKLVLAPDGLKPDQADILSAVDFQEKYYMSHLDHLYHSSYGMIVYRFNQANEPELLVLHEIRANVYSFPKGHSDPGETPLEAAKREVLEECALRLEPDEGFCEKVCYTIKPFYEKTLTMFSAKAEPDSVVIPREGEIDRFEWASPEKAKKLFRRHEQSELIDKVTEFIVSSR